MGEEEEAELFGDFLCGEAWLLIRTLRALLWRPLRLGMRRQFKWWRLWRAERDCNGSICLVIYSVWVLCGWMLLRVRPLLTQAVSCCAFQTT